MTPRNGLSSLMTRASMVLALLVTSSLLGCAFGEIRPTDPFDREWTLDQAQHRYTTLVRFSEFEKARKFVHEDQRDEFIVRMKSLEEARFTDFDSEEPEMSDDHREATVRVTYTIYTPAMPYETEVQEIQEWKREGVGNDWRVWSRFEGLDRLALK